MKKILTLALMWFLLSTSGQSLSASYVDCISLNQDIKEYSQYQRKIDSLFVILEGKNIEKQKDYYLKIKDVTDKYLEKSEV